MIMFISFTYQLIYNLFNALAILRTVWILFSLYNLEVAGFCPNGCQCDDVGLRVHCVNANLDTVPILLNPGTKHLDLSHNHIKRIMPGFAFYHELQYLDMSHNDVVSLGNKNFISQTLLTTLVISNNNISQLHAKTFDGLSVLKEIDLSYNYIEAIDNVAFEFLVGLKSLDLSHNKISHFPNDTFKYLRELKILNICNNKIKNLTKEIFAHLEELKELHLCSNDISVVKDNVFEKLRNVHHLSLFSNKIERFFSYSFNGLISLKLLDVHDNLLNEMPTQSLVLLTQLEELNIGMNSFFTLGSGAFENLLSLKKLYVSHCVNLTHLSKNVFNELENLLYLEISFNPKIKTLDLHIFKSLTALRRLVLRGNGLNSIEQDLLNLQSLQYLDLRDNSLVCNCSLKWLQDVEKNRSLIIKVEEVTCSHPENLRGRILTNLTDYELECYSQLLVIASCVAVAIAFVLLVIMISVIYYRHCKKMKTLVHDHWPEKIVATWRDPEYEKQIEDEEYTFQSARSLSQIQIPVI